MYNNNMLLCFCCARLYNTVRHRRPQKPGARMSRQMPLPQQRATHPLQTAHD